jgi:putative DNA primase/helicase
MRYKKMSETCSEENVSAVVENVLVEGAGRSEENLPHIYKNTINNIVYKHFDGIPSHEYIPEEMKKRDQWVWWKVKEVDGKTKKIPYNQIGRNGAKCANSVDSKTWSCLENVMGRTDFTPELGPGFALSDDDPYCFIDLDDCINKSTGEVASWAAEILEKVVDSYAEVSHSKEGIHVIIKAKLPEGRNRGVIDDEGHEIEIYDHSRIISMTGWIIEGFPVVIRDHQALAEEIQSRIKESEDFPAEEPENLGKSPDLEDEKIIELGLTEGDGKFKRLYDGDISEYSYDHSRADLALCNGIAFYTQKPEQIDRIFRSSLLMREKWDREDYENRTINKAIQGLRKIYKVHYGISISDLTKDKNKKGDLQFSYTKAAKSILDKVPFKLASWEVQSKEPSLWTCGDNGLWTKGGDFLIEQICDKVAEDLSRQANISEVKRRIKNDLRKEPIEFDTGKPTLVGTKNGFVCDLMTGEVRPMESEDYISEELVLPVDFKPNEKCPEIFKFYDSICSDDCSKMAMMEDDLAALNLQAWPYIAMFLGLGGNGKGQRQKFRRKFFGAQTIADISLKDLNDKGFVVSELYRKRILHCGEAKRNEKNGEKYSTAILKTLTGDDQVTTDQKYKSCLSFVPFCKVNIDANDPPRFDDESRGFTRRFRRINTPYYFTENPDLEDPTQRKIDEKLHERITTEEELSGYLNVLISLAKEIIPKRSYPACEHLTEGYEKQVYSIEEFKNQFCMVFEVDENEYTVIEDLYEAFKKWATLANASVVSSKAFGTTFKSLVGCCSNSQRIGSDVKKVYRGVRFDKERYNLAIADMTERLNNGSNGDSNQCKHLSEIYQNLKRKFGDDSW